MSQETSHPEPTIREAVPATSCRPTIRAVERADGAAIHELLSALIPDVIPERARWLTRWHWQYWDNPFRQGRAPGWVLCDAGRVLGHLGAVYLPVRLGDASLGAVVGADYAVSEAAAARGGAFAALELAQVLFSANPDYLVLATTANDRTAAVFGRFGCRAVDWTRQFWRAPATLHQQIRSCRGGASRWFRRLANSRYGHLVIRASATWGRRRPPRTPVPRGCRLEITVPQLARDLGRFWQMVAALELVSEGGSADSVLLRIDRSQAYLDWRYAHHPERDHMRVLAVRDRDDRALGAAILFREQRADRHVLYVEDLIVLPQRPDVTRALLCAGLSLACEHGADHLVSSPGRRAMRHLFWELGFEDRARNAPAAVIRTPAVPAGTIPATFAEPLEESVEFYHGMMY